jgi:small-conductance mechanosensitive channel
MKELMRLDRMLLHNPLSDWLIAMGVVALICLIVALIKPIVVRRLSILARRTETRFDDALVMVIQATKLWLVLIAAVYFGSEYLDLPRKAEKWLNQTAVIATFIQIGLWAGAVLEAWVERSRQRAMATDISTATSLSALAFVGKLVLWTVTILLALDNIGVNVTALVASLGIGGIAVALAVQNILGDLLASLSIVIDKPFVLGDAIVVDNFTGTVEHIGLKTTRVRSSDGEQIVFSNSDLLKTRLRNYKRMNERRVQFGFGVSSKTSLDQLKRIPQIVRRIIEAQPKTRFDRAHFKELSDSAYNFEVVYWMLDPNYNLYMDTRQAINLELVKTFADEGIGLASTTQTLVLATADQGALVQPRAASES